MPLNPRIADWTDRRVWLVGASTGIGRATAARLHGLARRWSSSARSAAALESVRARAPGQRGASRWTPPTATALRAAAAQDRGAPRPHRSGGVLRRHLRADARHRVRPRRGAAAPAGQLRRRAAPARRRAAAPAAPGRTGHGGHLSLVVQRGRLPRAAASRWPTARPRRR